ncbi:hypothetical protein FPV67DRAFT_1459206 [Lyophyllum atratum]|nr:hypothetical protein FPV67DRAFT_1459206 [Lyophyllum atratum]
MFKKSTFLLDSNKCNTWIQLGILPRTVLFFGNQTNPSFQFVRRRMRLLKPALDPGIESVLTYQSLTDLFVRVVGMGEYSPNGIYGKLGMRRHQEPAIEIPECGVEPDMSPLEINAWNRVSSYGTTICRITSNWVRNPEEEQQPRRPSDRVRAAFYLEMRTAHRLVRPKPAVEFLRDYQATVFSRTTAELYGPKADDGLILRWFCEKYTRRPDLYIQRRMSGGISHDDPGFKGRRLLICILRSRKFKPLTVSDTTSPTARISARVEEGEQKWVAGNQD